MNSEDDTITYLKFLSDNSGNDLLQTSYELQDSLPAVESFFTENETWTPECFPIPLSNATLNGYEENVGNKGDSESKLASSEAINGSNDGNELKSGTICIPVIQEEVQNDYILQVNGTTHAVKCTPKIEKKKQMTDLEPWNDFYSVLTAFKCKICSCLCEDAGDMFEHFNRLHGDLMKLKETEENCKKVKSKIRMKSILISNKNNNDNLRENNDEETEHLTTLFICNFCNNLFATRQLLMEHLKQIHESLPENSEFSESEKRESTCVMRNLARKLIRGQQTSMKRVKCSVEGCILKFSNTETKNLHEECHVKDKKQFLCSVCDQKFSVWRNCSRHLWIHHKIDTGLYTCPMCNKFKSNSPIVVINHMDIHGSERPFKCSECGKGFKQDTQLRNHSLTHKTQEVDEKLPPWSTSAKCSICERYFANPKSLKNHVESVHEKLKPFVCNICGHKTTRKAMLELHLRQHTGDKPFKCPHCAYRTADHNCLRRHKMKHYGVMKYSCPHCKYKAIQSSSFKKHLEIHHPDKEGVHKCDKCTFTTLNFQNYLTHVKCHEFSTDVKSE